MQPYKPKVYTASKIKHRTKWQGTEIVYRDKLEFTARWVFMSPGPDHDSTFWTPAQKQLHWIQDIQDVQRSDFLLAYAEPEDPVKGTLVEIGAAIAACKIVLAVGFDDSHSWQAHPLVLPMPTVAVALSYILGAHR